MSEPAAPTPAAGQNRATERPEGFEKPAHWSNEPAPEPEKPEGQAEDPQGLSPTRYGDWTIKGVAVDF